MWHRFEFVVPPGQPEDVEGDGGTIDVFEVGLGTSSVAGASVSVNLI